MQAQIVRGKSELGDWIYNTTKERFIENIVEIGTGNGLGSTKCIYDAIIDSKKQKYKVYSVELNFEHYKQAIANLPKIPNFHLIHGYITDKMTPPNNFNKFLMKGYTEEQAWSWYKRDLEDYKTCGNVIDILPERIDLLILDGGPFTGMEEFSLLECRSRYIVLDDTMDIKNYSVYQTVLTNTGKYDILIDRPDDRNGYLVCKRNP